MKAFEKETRRALFHIALSFMLVSFHYFVNEALAILLYTATIIVGFVLSLISKKHDVPLLSHFIRCFDNKDADFPGKGAFFYLIAATLSLIIFTPNVAYASIIFLGVADGTAKLVGRNGKFKYHYSSKTIEGSVAGACAGIAITAFFFIPPLIAVIAGILTMVIESFDHPSFLDDNLVTPLVFGMIAQYLASAFVFG